MDKIQRKKLKQYLEKIKNNGEVGIKTDSDYSEQTEYDKYLQNMQNQEYPEQSEEYPEQKDDTVVDEKTKDEYIKDPRFRDHSSISEEDRRRFLPTSYSDLDESDKNKYKQRVYPKLQKILKPR